MMTAEERASRASRLRELLEHGDVLDAFASIEDELTEEWKVAQKTEERENLWQSIRVLGMLRTRLGQWSHADISAIRRA